MLMNLHNHFPSCQRHLDVPRHNPLHDVVCMIVPRHQIHHMLRPVYIKKLQ